MWPSAIEEASGWLAGQQWRWERGCVVEVVKELLELDGGGGVEAGA
jgi:hypothetical protein